MKTAVSIPDRLFNAADGLARRLRITRSELYARALADYLAAESDEEITSRLDAVYADVDSHLDPQIADAQYQAVKE